MVHSGVFNLVGWLPTPDMRSDQHAAPLLALQHTVTKNTAWGQRPRFRKAWVLPLAILWLGWDAFHGVMYVPDM